VIPVRSMRYRIRKHRYFTEQGKKKGWPGLTCGKYEVLNKKQQVGELPQAFTFKPDGSLTSQQVVRWQGNSAACLDRSLDIGMTITRHSSSHLAESLIMEWMSNSKGFSANPFFNQQTPCSRIPGWPPCYTSINKAFRGNRTWIISKKSSHSPNTTDSHVRRAAAEHHPYPSNNSPPAPV
jgi:hypothetical protein